MTEHHEESEAEYAGFDQIDVPDDPDISEEQLNELLDAGEETVLIRIVEWTEWLPGQQDESSELVLNQGVTGFQTGKTERLLEVAVSGTGRNRRIRIQNDDSGKVTTVPYALYAFQAVLAQNVSKPVFDSLMAVQRPPKEGSNSKEIIVTNQMPGKVPPPPPKKKRRNR
jgi:hypothetical protein